ncbi:MAG TPA: T9SS type A sorting domain-containing protein, partial [Bacteroidia bacterium]|nr:T9SS type A sorting domain-containing protein [Bacteroidia bacterium]
LCAGAYTVSVTDKNGCTGNSNGTVNQPAMLNITGTSVNATCFGSCNGQATITPSGGTTPYNYSWSNGATAGNVTGLCAGSYTCIVTDINGCTHDTIINITQPTVITATVTSTSANCGKSDGSANIVASGGTGAYTYSWAPSGGTSTTANNLAAGTYTCNVTDANSCMVSFTVNVNNNSSLKDTVTSHVNVTCNGLCNGSAIGSASGGTTPYTYAWSPSGGTNTTANSLCANAYNFTVTDSKGCIYINSVTITQPAPLTVVIDSGGINVPCKDTIWATVSGGTTPYTYSWNTGATTDSLKGICGGVYTVTVNDANGCGPVKATVYIIPVGIQEYTNVADLKIYPIPTSGELNILLNNQNLMPQSIMVYDITGRKVMEQRTDKNSTLIHMDVSALSNGTYILEINGLNGTKIVRFTVGK